VKKRDSERREHNPNHTFMSLTIFEFTRERETERLRETERER